MIKVFNPAIEKAKPTLDKVLNEEFWEAPGLLQLESIRNDIRDLMHLIEEKKESLFIPILKMNLANRRSLSQWSRNRQLTKLGTRESL